MGRRGERFAAKWLGRQGYKIIYRNFRPVRGGGEVDLVCRQRDTLVFIEVKTRSSLTYGRPAEAVDAEKQELICRGAREWLRLLKKPEVPVRFDIVEVIANRDGSMACNLVADAFAMPETVLTNRT